MASRLNGWRTLLTVLVLQSFLERSILFFLIRAKSPSSQGKKRTEKPRQANFPDIVSKEMRFYIREEKLRNADRAFADEGLRSLIRSLPKKQFLLAGKGKSV